MMRIHRPFGFQYIFVLFFLHVLATAAHPQQNREKYDLHQNILKTYNFHPHELDDKGLKEKSAILDTF